jgi:hypothetical protein
MACISGIVGHVSRVDRWGQEGHAAARESARADDAGDARAAVGGRRARAGRRDACGSSALELPRGVRDARIAVAAVGRCGAGACRLAACSRAAVGETIGEAARDTKLVELAGEELRCLRPAAVGARGGRRTGVAPVPRACGVVARVPLGDADTAVSTVARVRAVTDRAACSDRARHLAGAEDARVERLSTAAIGVGLAKVPLHVTALGLLANRDPRRTVRCAELAAAPARTPEVRRVAKNPVDVARAARRGRASAGVRRRYG